MGMKTRGTDGLDGELWPYFTCLVPWDTSRRVVQNEIMRVLQMSNKMHFYFFLTEQFRESQDTNNCGYVGLGGGLGSASRLFLQSLSSIGFSAPRHRFQQRKGTSH